MLFVGLNCTLCNLRFFVQVGETYYMYLGILKTCQVLHPSAKHVSCIILLLLECLLLVLDNIDHFDKIQYVHKLHVSSLSLTKVYIF